MSCEGAEPADQMVEVVGLDGGVLEVVTRSQMREQRLRHKCTYIVVVDHDERLVVHQRAPWKDVWPSRWDVAFGGVVGVGEDWLDSAKRELLEEAGIESDLLELGTGTYDDSHVSVLGRVYLARHDGPFTFVDGEVVASDRVALDEIENWIRTHEVCADSLAIAAGAFLR